MTNSEKKKLIALLFKAMDDGDLTSWNPSSGIMGDIVDVVMNGDMIQIEIDETD